MKVFAASPASEAADTPAEGPEAEKPPLPKDTGDPEADEPPLAEPRRTGSGARRDADPKRPRRRPRSSPRPRTASKASKTPKAVIPLSFAAALTAVGIVYGDMGTSPVYTVKAVVHGQGGLAQMSDEAVIGFLSLVFWSMTLIATVKYVLFATRADNHGEGGIFALYNLVRRHWKGLSVVAMVGGATFLADSMLTPAVSITSAVEGLKATPLLGGVDVPAQTVVVVLSVAIVSALFLAQHAGTSLIGRFFGPAMTVWFAFIACMGLLHLPSNPQVLQALNPLEGVRFLASGENRAGFAILGTVFLAVTGAEALYSDIGHVGRSNVYATWPLVKLALLLNYFGQGAWIIENRADGALQAVEDVNPFFEMMPDLVRPFGVVVAIVAGIIASQALISGAFSLVAEAEGLFWLPRLPVSYPGEAKGQVYIPVANLVLWAGATFAIVFFQSSENMEAAYGLALTLTMLATTMLLSCHIWKERGNPALAAVLLVFYGALEGLFFVSSLVKFFEGGYVTVLMAAALFALMLVYSVGSTLQHVHRDRLPVADVLPLFRELSQDRAAPFVADNLVYLTADSDMKAVDGDLVASVLRDRGRRANAYWVVTVVQTGTPYTCEYALDSFETDYFFRVRIRLGYKMHQYLLQGYMRQIMREQLANGTLPERRGPYDAYLRMVERARVERPGGKADAPAGGGTEKPRTADDAALGSVRYVLMSKEISPESSLPGRYRTVVRVHRFLQQHGNAPARWFGLELTDPIVEKVILFPGGTGEAKLARIPLRGQKLDGRLGEK